MLENQAGHTPENH